MIELGKHAILKATRFLEQGLYLSDQEGDEVLLPNKYVPENIQIDDEIEVFIYQDHEHRITATTQVPKIKLHEFAWLKVNSLTGFGAFLDWGLLKDIFVPLSEQQVKMKEGESYIVYLYVDERTNRLVASAKIDKFIEKENIDLEVNQEVNLLIANTTDIGINVIVNNRYKGLLYKNEVFQRIYMGDRVKGYIKMIRPDNKIDVALEKPGFANNPDNMSKILNSLKENNGFLPLSDNSDPEVISQYLGMSKKTFKKTIGTLYKEKLIRIEYNGIYLVK